MKKKVGTILDEDLLFRAKKTALVKRKSLSQILEDALKAYLNTTEKAIGEKRGSVAQGTQGAMKISRHMLKAVMEEEGVYES
ncbi:MAG: hypothetical protein A2W05_02655 [Candidatus Schekmanbacteria bacterium RBG_16_38_10]|uniref:Uncharacterized protein n=1 Tax=Candidatus Schekmanbacteria bacterium RBG_16_38_10 TaxID=1817879 RepID=A0A1F7RME2_9BACT|nr:hypothetical protein [Thermodesulfovibrionia bacterium]OGL42755.1 MAG: hypothetical protein A2W05_02655 [Candidatus Schekmanbacteria bacterium RBG_16_38_10]